jgi:hypothetical protein
MRCGSLPPVSNTYFSSSSSDSSRPQQRIGALDRRDDDCGVFVEATDGHRLGEPAPEGLGMVKEEDTAQPRHRVGMIAKQDLGARGDIFEAELALAPDETLGHGAQIARSLVREAGEGRAFEASLR